jgi:hypothetical protein
LLGYNEINNGTLKLCQAIQDTRIVGPMDLKLYLSNCALDALRDVHGLVPKPIDFFHVHIYGDGRVATGQDLDELARNAMHDRLVQFLYKNASRR